MVAIGALGGAVLGGTVAYVAATWVFVCRDTIGFDAVCSSEKGWLAVLWGIPIGALVGIVAGYLVSRMPAHSA
jgi:hypothetical protein